MKRITIMTMAILAFTTFSFAQEDESYVMFENTRMAVKTDKYKEFGKAMAHHNKTYHADGPYHANVWNIAIGEDAGQMVWSMGPCTFEQHDHRPDGSEHMEDWLYNVMPNIKYIASSNLWRRDKKLNHSPNDAQSSKLSIRVYDIKDWQEYRFKELLNKAMEVYKANNYDWSLSVYWPEFEAVPGEDVALVWGFDKWAFFDNDSNFKNDFEEVHGEGSWFKFIEELKGTVESSRDEVWELVPEISGSGE